MNVLKKLMKLEAPNVVFLMETREECHEIEKRKSMLGKRNFFLVYFRVSEGGRDGGIGMFWREDLIEIEILASNSCTITGAIKCKEMVDWVFTAIYASPNPSSREQGIDFTHG